LRVKQTCECKRRQVRTPPNVEIIEEFLVGLIVAIRKLGGIKMSKRNEFDLAKIEQAAALLKQAGYHVYPDQSVLTVECCWQRSGRRIC
jgi:ferredoxin-thioredoxin reductase catalytic subunit